LRNISTPVQVVLMRDQAHDLDFLADLDDAALHAAGHHGAAAGDGEHVFHRHQEGAVHGALGRRDVAVQRVGQLHDGLLAQLALVAFQRQLGRALDDRGVVAGEVVLGQQLAHFHLDQLEQLGVVHHVALVQEHDDVAARPPGGPAGCARASGASGRRRPSTPGSRRPSGRRR
jgi:hypothetical protein